MVNYLISAYSVNPYKGSEDSIGWNWVLQYEKNYKEGDRIILLTKKFNEKDTRRGLKEFNIQHVELVIVDVPNFHFYRVTFTELMETIIIAGLQINGRIWNAELAVLDCTCFSLLH